MKLIRLSLLFTVLCGIIYPLTMTGIAKLVFPHQADGSLIKNKNGTVIGSSLIGQNFQSPKYFHGRISSIYNNAAASGSNNYAPSNKEMLERVKKSIAELKKENPDLKTQDIPLDLITHSGSGLDPDISVAAAELQIPRVAKATGISEDQLKKLVKDHVTGRSLGLFGEPRINVLRLNIALDHLSS
ncbi:potassium-transporting ATPase subunit KdpC [Camelliibacillus cellulosilyticus]|uniref:Potassium-transporting ATPase KdpC subunit n=1 Tax=Camelliibacillus cellulosilyticus TaxID=2174486 RepID=A0ABV9GRT4_9BACL